MEEVTVPTVTPAIRANSSMESATASGSSYLSDVTHRYRGLQLFIGHTNVIQHSSVTQTLGRRLPQTIRGVKLPAADAEFIVLRVRVPHSLEAILALLQVRPEAAEHTARALADGRD